ncbi:MAG: hypothetical protein ACK6DA_01165 [Candidatus Kapaibacterium sp.]
MKNIFITALVVSNVFTGVILYCFTTGQVARSEVDYISAIAEPDAPRPVKLAKR